MSDTNPHMPEPEMSPEERRVERTRLRAVRRERRRQKISRAMGKDKKKGKKR